MNINNHNNLIFLLLVLYFCDNQIRGRKRFQKIICILKHKYNIPFRFEFVPYHYGPYSEYLSNTIDTLVGSGIIKEKFIVLDTFNQYLYELSDYGKEMTENFIREKDKDVMLEKIRKSSHELNNMETADLVKISKKIFGM